MHIYEDYINDYFLKNKYSKWYFSIINNALSCNRKKSKNVYFEAHHILPAAAFPEYKRFSLNRWNKVLLTSKEHYIVHLLLPFTTDNKSHKAKYLKAFKIICFINKFLNKNSVIMTLLRKFIFPLIYIFHSKILKK